MNLFPRYAAGIDFDEKFLYKETGEKLLCNSKHETSYKCGTLK